MAYIKFFKILQNLRMVNGCFSSKSMEINGRGRQFTSDSTSQKAVRLAYDLYSPPRNKEKYLPPVILLHSMLDCRKTWNSIAPEIAKRTGRKVYALDARNHGESPWGDEITFDLLTEDLEAFLRRHNINKATLVGHSMGGRTSLSLALKKPEMVEKLVIEDMHTRKFRPVQDGPIMQSLKVIKDTVQYIPTNADESELRKVFLEIMDPLLLSDTSKLAQVNKSFDSTMLPFKNDNGCFSYIANLNAVEIFMTTSNICQDVRGVYIGDALFIYGTKSYFRVDTDPHILEHFPRAIKLAVEGGSHFIHFEDPKRFVDEVTNFVNGYNNLK